MRSSSIGFFILGLRDQKTALMASAGVGGRTRRKTKSISSMRFPHYAVKC